MLKLLIVIAIIFVKPVFAEKFNFFDCDWGIPSDLTKFNNRIWEKGKHIGFVAFPLDVKLREFLSESLSMGESIQKTGHP